MLLKTLKFFANRLIYFKNLLLVCARYANDLIYKLRIDILSQRSNSFEKFTHFSFFILTSLFLILGFGERLVASSGLEQVIIRDELFLANIDMISQGNSTKLSRTVNPNIKFNLFSHVVLSGDRLEDIAARYSVEVDTIKWANLDRINQYTNAIKVGDTLYIPELNGVVYEAKEGDTLDSILQKTNGDRFQVVEINQLAYQGFQVRVGQKIMVPGGRLPPPPPLIPYQNWGRVPTNQGANIFVNIDFNKLNGISFVNPLSNPDCTGYVLSRGFFTGHNGADLAKGGGCPIRSIAAGTVAFAGWGNFGEGFHVRVDHGNGVSSVYFHAETLWVSSGQVVSAGQEIMYMGCTGNCTGTHLHLGLRIDGIYIDPAPYVPY